MLKEIQQPIKENLEQFSSIFRSSLKSDSKLIEKMSSYLFTMHGKQMRPLLLFLTAQMLGGIKEDSYHSATVIELIHTASLVHDDVVDEAYMRRGKWSLNTLYRSKGAVLAGDFVLARALRIAMEHKLYTLLDMMAKIIEEMSKGELMQSDYSRKLNITTEQYYEVIRYKTALLLAACSCAGAESSGASKEDIERMFRFGELLGLAFQVKDDILDYTKKSATGKIACNDLKEQKLTLPIISILEKSTPKRCKEILAMVRVADTKPEVVAKLRAIVLDEGGVDIALKHIERMKNEAIELLAPYPDSPCKEALIKYAEFVLKREK